MENNTKMSDMANIEPKDIDTVKILICYLLYKIDNDIQPDQLYEITAKSQIINYFYYQEAIDSLMENNAIIKTVKSDGLEYFSITHKGEMLAESFKNYAQKSYRDKLVGVALKYFSKIKRESEIKIDYIELKNGYYVHIRCLDIGDDLLDLKVYAPDMVQAKLLGEKIMLNPVGFYGKIVGFALDNKEEVFDLTDN